MKQKEKFIPKNLYIPFFFFVALCFENEWKQMKRKTMILGVVAALCLVGTVVYVRALHEEHDQKVAEWKESAKTAFEEALWMEVDKRSEIPMYSMSSGEKGFITLNGRIPDTVSVMTKEGFREYKIDRNKYERSLIKETRTRTRFSTLLKKYPLQIDTLAMHWDSLMSEKNIPVSSKIRYVYTDLKLLNDTVCSSVENRLRFDSLSVSYLGFRCEHELTAFVSYPYWLQCVSFGNWLALMFPWLLLILLFLNFPKLEKLVKHKFVREKIVVQEKTIEVEKEVYIANVQIEKADVVSLQDGTLFDPIGKFLSKGEIRHYIKPQTVSLLKLFLSKSDCKLTASEISWALWKEESEKDKLYSAIRRLRNDLKTVQSDLIVSCTNREYELKFPISSCFPDQQP